MSSATVSSTAKIAELEQRIRDLEKRLEKLEHPTRLKQGRLLTPKP